MPPRTGTYRLSYRITSINAIVCIFVALGVCTHAQTAGYIGPDTYREGYSGGTLDANLVDYACEEEGKDDCVVIYESSRHNYPTKEQPRESPTVNIATFLIDGNMGTVWWSAI